MSRHDRAFKNPFSDYNGEQLSTPDGKVLNVVMDILSELNIIDLRKKSLFNVTTNTTQAHQS